MLIKTYVTLFFHCNLIIIYQTETKHAKTDWLLLFEYLVTQEIQFY